MCFRKKQPLIKDEEKKENKLVMLITYELTPLEQPIYFDFSHEQIDFYFCGQPKCCYDKQDFSFAEEQFQRAINLFKEALLVIKDNFKKSCIENKIVLSKIKDLLKLERDFQKRIAEEHKIIQTNKIAGILFTTNELFQTLSREYMNFAINTKEQLLMYISKNFVSFDLINEFSKILKEQEQILPTELSDYKYNLNGYSIIYNLENFLRVAIINVLKSVPTKQMMESELYENIKQAKEKEFSNKWCDERYGGDLFFLNFTDLVKIIKYKNFDFEKANIKIEKINSEIDKVSTIRNKIAHNNPISKDDLEILKANCKIIIKSFSDFKEIVLNYKFNTKAKK